MPVFKTIHTSAGLRLMAQAQATGKPINLVAMAVGDGKGKPVTPNPEQTQLAREIAGSRAVPNRVYQREGEDNIFYAELVLPDEVQGVTLREWGIFDDTGALFAVGNLPESYIPKPDEGAYGDAIVRVKFAVVNAEVVTILVDPNVAKASQAWVIQNMTFGRLMPGGLTGQMLVKRSNADGDAEWQNPDQVNIAVDTVEESQILAAGQRVVDLAITNTHGLAVYVDHKRLGKDQWTAHETVLTRLTLAESYPAGTSLIAVQNEPAGSLAGVLQRDKNLADLENAALARSNLGVYSKDEADASGQPGDIKYTVRSTAPAGWLKANGAAISRTAYAALFSVIGETYGKGDGFNTFNIPDLRGEFIRGLDDGRGIDVKRALGSNQGDQLGGHAHEASTDAQGGHTHSGSTNSQGSHSHNGTTGTQGSHTHSGSTSTDGAHQHDSGWGEGSGGPYGFARTNVQGSGDSDYDNRSFLTSSAGEHSHTVETTAAGDHSHTIETDAAGDHAHTLKMDSAGSHSHKITVSATVGNETRPRNVALLACIKY